MKIHYFFKNDKSAKKEKTINDDDDGKHLKKTIALNEYLIQKKKKN